MLRKRGICLLSCILGLVLFMQTGITAIAVEAIEERHIITVHNEEELLEAIENDNIRKIIFKMETATRSLQNTLTLSAPLTINGELSMVYPEDNPLIIQVTGNFRHIVAHEDTNSLSFENVILDGGGIGGGVEVRGNISIDNAIIQNCFSSSYGGGIHVAANQALNLSNSRISSNMTKSEFGGGIYAGENCTLNIDSSEVSYNSISDNAKYSSYGGGIAVYSKSVLNINNSEISYNYIRNNLASSNAYGGGIYAQYTPVKINNSIISYNSVEADMAIGGGIYANSHNNSSIVDSEINGNKAIGTFSAGGGGINFNYSSLEIINSDFYNNEVFAEVITAKGGAISISTTPTIPSYHTTIKQCRISNNSSLEGGGLFIYQSEVEIEDTDISDNFAGLSGGGIYSHISDVTLRNTTVAGNEAQVDGGGIYANVLGTLFVDENSTFSRNQAEAGYVMISTSDVLLHNNQIHATQFTAPFYYGYNNFDISYTKGEKLRTVTINFYANGKELYHSVDALAGFAFPIQLLPQDPVMEGFSFRGWFNDADDTPFNSGAVITDDQEFYAMWRSLR